MFRMAGKPVKFEKVLHKTFMKLLQLFGIIVFRDEQNNLKTSNGLILLVYIRMMLYFTFSIFSVVLIATGDKTLLVKTTDIIWTIAALFYAECTWLYTILRSRKHVELYSRIRSFDIKLGKLHTTVDYDCHVKFVKLEAIIRMVHIVVPTIGQVLGNLQYKNNYEHWSAIILFCSIAVMNTLFSHMITNYIRNIKDRFAILNVLLTELLSETDVNIIQNSKVKEKYGSSLLLLSNVCYLHHYLTKLVKLANHVFGFNLVVLFAVGFINIIVGLFYCSSAFQSFDANWRIVVANLLLAIFYATDILYICHQGQYAIEEAKKAGLLIHKIETSDYDIKDEIEMFSLQIANEKVEFNAAGFFPINYTLVFSVSENIFFYGGGLVKGTACSALLHHEICKRCLEIYRCTLDLKIIGGVTTYLIILIQLAANKSINSTTSN